MKKNETNVIDDIVTYANTYGLDALGYAVLDMVIKNELHISQEEAEGVWEYGGNIK